MELINETAFLLNKDFGQEEETALKLHNDLTENDLKLYLQNVITWYIETDFHTLVNIFYRLDIHEQKFNTIVDTQMGDELTSGLADLVLEREMQKAKTRLAYREYLKKTEEEKNRF
ncbi:MAG: hypothetical protein DRI74_02305 [Bacteroidetes bacterium]|nr:MAG: hypothetical protein DRI74_02305 [Bacteroidota bacterium]